MISHQTPEEFDEVAKELALLEAELPDEDLTEEEQQELAEAAEEAAEELYWRELEELDAL